MTTSPLLELFGEHWHRSSCIVSSLLLISTSVSCMSLLESFVISPREDLNWYLSSFVRKFSRSHTADGISSQITEFFTRHFPVCCCQGCCNSSCLSILLTSVKQIYFLQLLFWKIGINSPYRVFFWNFNRSLLQQYVPDKGILFPGLKMQIFICTVRCACWSSICYPQEIRCGGN